MKIALNNSNVFTQNYKNIKSHSRCSMIFFYYFIKNDQKLGIIEGSPHYCERYEGYRDFYIAKFDIIKQEERSKGYGSLMMQQFIEYLKERGIMHIRLLVETSNQIAINFYEKFKFQKAPYLNDGRYYEMNLWLTT